MWLTRLAGKLWEQGEATTRSSPGHTPLTTRTRRQGRGARLAVAAAAALGTPHVPVQLPRPQPGGPGCEGCETDGAARGRDVGEGTERGTARAARSPGRARTCSAQPGPSSRTDSLTLALTTRARCPSAPCPLQGPGACPWGDPCVRERNAVPATGVRLGVRVSPACGVRARSRRGDPSGSRAEPAGALTRGRGAGAARVPTPAAGGPRRERGRQGAQAGAWSRTAGHCR